MLADQGGPGNRHRHPVLELVAEAIGATRLVEGRARHDAAAERLIEQPAVQHHIHRSIGRLDLDGAEDVIPFLLDLLQHRVEIGAPVAHDQGDGLGPGRRLAEKEDDLRRGIGRQVELGLQHGAGIHSRAGPIGERRVAGECGGKIEPAVPPEEFRPVAGPALLPPAEIGEGDPRSEFGPPGVAGQHRAAIRIDLGHHIRARGAARGPQDPFHIARHRQPPMPLRLVADRQPGDLDRILEGHVLQKLERNAVGGMLEAAIALAMPGDIGRGLLADGERRRAPDIAVLLVAQIDGFARRIDDGIVRPGRELVLPAVDRPAVAAALGRDLEAEGWIGDHIDPGRGRGLAPAEDRHIFPSVGG